MFVIIGFVVALGCVFGMFIAHGGNIAVILHALPFELVTIMGAAGGAFVHGRAADAAGHTALVAGDLLEGLRRVPALDPDLDPELVHRQ